MTTSYRYAVVSGNAATIANYLPADYSVLGPALTEALPEDSDLGYIVRVSKDGCVIVGGHDNAGWTLDGYVLPRLASGCYGAREIDADTAQTLLGVELPVESWTPDQMCEWFALCDHEATGTRSHPVLGEVPICDRCAAKVEALA